MKNVTKTKKIKYISFFIFFSLFINLLYSQNNNPTQSLEEPQTQNLPLIYKIDSSRMPEIPSLNPKDQMYKEYSYIVQDNYKLIAKNICPEVYFFKYTVKDNSSLLQVASRCNITYDTIACVNKLETSNDSIRDKTLILPTTPGLFVPKNKGSTSLELLLTGAYSRLATLETPIYIIDGKEYYFFVNKKFSPTERAYFLDATLRLPIDKDKFWISSEYGYRKNPFSGEMKNHKGIDLAANIGTPVYAIKDGVVSSTIYNDTTFGNYIVLTHTNGSITSIYAHLSKINVTQGSQVLRGQQIGQVGQSGMATGPHLHFEIRQRGVSINPESKLNLK